uniref:Agmatine deiminase n=1 Tax=Mucochytrium quahogii TaxID=96639 RepID=A0A7S2RPY1_9STRA|mmetsp:Transcript_18648/g.30418  ORF Transcript_18648/g.30418 Transcript_18648/m.30418 type:complete len:343 (-) Transcript_18648:140-1168(-)
MRILLAFCLLATICQGRRVVPEWEPQDSVWLQWGYDFEAAYRPAMTRIIKIASQYTNVNVLVRSRRLKYSAKRMVKKAKANMDNVTFIVKKYDNAWMRDNGPIYVDVDEDIVVGDWKFDAWGNTPGNLGYKLDNQIPAWLTKRLGFDTRYVYDFVMERGAVEFNGNGAVITTWPTMKKRNPRWTKEDMELLFKRAWGLDKVVWVNTVPPSDKITGGHIDGIARFISKDTVVVTKARDPEDEDAAAYDAAASDIGEHFNVIRLTGSPEYKYKRQYMYGNYMNWLVGDGYVLVPGFGMPESDTAARATVQTFFPDRDIYTVDIRALWYNGGGIHCVTNDIPKYK